MSVRCEFECAFVLDVNLGMGFYCFMFWFSRDLLTRWLWGTNCLERKTKSIIVALVATLSSLVVIEE